MGNWGLESFIVFVLILANGVFSMAEISMIAARKARLREKARNGNKNAKVALNLATNPDRFLSTTQFGITLIGILTGAYGGATIAKSLAVPLRQISWLAPYADTAALFLVVLVITYLSLILGELVPKQLGLAYAETIAINIARPMCLLSRLGAPAIALLSLSTKLVLKLLHLRPSDEPSVTEDELRHMVKQATQAGVLAESEQELVERMLRLGDRRVTTFMTPHTEIDWLDINDSNDENWGRIAASGHTHFVVCRGNLDNVVGILSARKLLNQFITKGDRAFRPLLDPPLFIPERIPALRALELMKGVKHPLGLILDEYGGISGMVTLDDFVSTVFFDIKHHAAPGEPMAVQREDGSWLLSGMIPIAEYKAMFRLKEPSEDADFDTLGGYVMNALGRIPQTTDTFEAAGMRLEVMDMDGRRVDKVLVNKLIPTDDSAGPANEDAGDELGEASDGE